MSLSDIYITNSIDSQMEEVIGRGLDRFNESKAGCQDRQALAVVIKDDDGNPVGGALGRSSLGLLFLDLFYLPESLRGCGLGTRILSEFEEEGRRRGCRSAVLYTISFQAPEFYLRNGWVKFGEVACDPGGTSRVFLMKSLAENGR